MARFEMEYPPRVQEARDCFSGILRISAERAQAAGTGVYTPDETAGEGDTSENFRALFREGDDEIHLNAYLHHGTEIDLDRSQLLFARCPNPHELTASYDAAAASGKIPVPYTQDELIRANTDNLTSLVARGMIARWNRRYDLTDPRPHPILTSVSRLPRPRLENVYWRMVASKPVPRTAEHDSTIRAVNWRLAQQALANA